MSIAKSHSLDSTKLYLLIGLTHLRWGIPIIAEIWRGEGAKFIFLTNRLGLSRDALSRTLEYLIAKGWVKKNRGYGHPMRPEYQLTIEGEALAPACARLLEKLREEGLEQAALNKWSLPVLWGLAQGLGRFSELQSCLRGISPRALTLTLSELEQSQLIERKPLYGPSKRFKYQLAKPGRAVVALLENLIMALAENLES